MKPKMPIVALLLSLLMLGLGQLYNGQTKKAILVYLLALSLSAVLSLTSISFSIGGLLFLLSISLLFRLAVLVDAFRAAKKDDAVGLSKYDRWYVYATIFVLHAFVLVPVLQNQVFPKPVTLNRIISTSMLPNLQPGDRVIFNINAFSNRAPKRGDIVAFANPLGQSDRIGRVIALPGESVAISSNKVLINGQSLKEPWAVTSDTLQNFEPVTVPEHKYFILGDNRSFSYDSRAFGPIDQASIKAKVLYVYWSSDKSRIGKVIQ